MCIIIYIIIYISPSRTNEETVSSCKRPRVEKKPKSKRPSILDNLDIHKLSIPDIVPSPFHFTPCRVPGSQFQPEVDRQYTSTLQEISSSFSLILP